METEQARKRKNCPGDASCHFYQSSNAVDGDINTCTRPRPIGTNTPDKRTWWYVDLEKELSIYSIIIQFKGYGEDSGNGCYSLINYVLMDFICIQLTQTTYSFFNCHEQYLNESSDIQQI